MATVMRRKTVTCDCGHLWPNPETGGHATWCALVKVSDDTLDEWEDFYSPEPGELEEFWSDYDPED